MKRYLALGCFGIGLLVSPVLAGIVHAAVPSSPKIGIVNLQDTLQSTPAGKRATASFESTVRTKQGQLDKQKDELTKAGAELNKLKPTLSAQAFDEKRQPLEKKFAELQELYMKLERELGQDRMRLTQDLMKQAEPKLAAIAKAEGVSVIFEKSATVWSEPTVDLTAKLNAEMK